MPVLSHSVGGCYKCAPSYKVDTVWTSAKHPVRFNGCDSTPRTWANSDALRRRLAFLRSAGLDQAIFIMLSLSAMQASMHALQD